MQKNLFNALTLKPATLSVLIQLAAFLFVLLLAYAIHWLSVVAPNVSFEFPLLIFVLLQGGLAAYFSTLADMAPWWRWIHLFFPLAIFLMSNFDVPNEVYLAGFIFTLAFYWTSFRTQVPYYPSRENIWREVAKFVPVNKPIRMIDIGSGLGGMSMHLARNFPKSLIEGIEIAPLPWLVSYLRAKLMQSAAVFKLGNYHQLDFANYDLIFAYLSPAAMPDLWIKASTEMRAGSLLLSYEFAIPGVAPTQVIDDVQRRVSLYVWKID